MRLITSSSAATSYSSPRTGAESGLSLHSYGFISFLNYPARSVAYPTWLFSIRGHGHVTVANEHGAIISKNVCN